MKLLTLLLALSAGVAHAKGPLWNGSYVSVDAIDGARRKVVFAVIRNPSSLAFVSHCTFDAYCDGRKLPFIQDGRTRMIVGDLVPMDIRYDDGHWSMTYLKAPALELARVAFSVRSREVDASEVFITWEGKTYRFLRQDVR